MKNKNILIRAVMASGLILMMNSCYFDQILPPDLSGTPVLFGEDIQPIFNSNCTTSGCHSGAVAPNLLAGNSYNNLKNGNYINTTAPEISELYLWMTGQKAIPMPPSGPNATNNAKILEWIKQGALNN